LARQVIGPYDLEQDLGLVGGNVYGGELSVDQMFHMRPAPGYADYRTPIRGLYNGSAGAHGGGGVSGIPGWQAFRQAMADKKREERRRSLARVARRPSR
jgi:phytoene dehydrogenase-like protein